MKTYSLFEGRHELPENQGAICTSFDFTTNKVVKSPLWDEAIEACRRGENVELYVTGLTPALTQFIGHSWSAYHNMWADGGINLTLLHYNSQTGEYWKQAMG